MNLELLMHNKKWIPIIADWYIEEWGHLKGVGTREEEIEKLGLYLNENKVPLIIVAFENDELLGVAQLKTYEMSIYPNYRYWLGGVYVNKLFRNRGIARAIINKTINKALELNIDKLYLQTQDLNGGLYKDLGWSKVEMINYNGINTLVMDKVIKHKQ